MNLRKTAALLLVSAVCMSLCSCGYNPKVVGTITDPDGNKTDITCGQYLCAQYEITTALLNEAGVSGEIDMEKTMDSEYDGGTVRTYVQKATAERLLKRAVTDYMFANMDIEDDESVQLYYDSYIQSDWSASSSTLVRNGISFDSFHEYEMKSIRATRVPYIFYGEGGEQALTEDFVNNYIKNRYGRFTYISLPYHKLMDIALTDEDKAKLRSYAEQILEEAMNAQVADVVSVRERIAAAAEAHATDYLNMLGYDQDMDSITYEGQQLMYGDGTLTNAQYDQMFPSNPGDYMLIDGGDGLFIIAYRENNVPEEDTYENLLDKVITVVANDRFPDYLEEKSNEFTLELDPKAIKYYSPDKIVF